MSDPLSDPHRPGDHSVGAGGGPSARGGGHDLGRLQPRLRRLLLHLLLAARPLQLPRGVSRLPALGQEVARGPRQASRKILKSND